MRSSPRPRIWLLGLVVVLVLAACTEPTGGGRSATSSQGYTPDSEVVCPADDPFGCVEYAEGEPIRIATLTVISGPSSTLGLDSAQGVKVAIALRGEVAGRSVDVVANDDTCSAEGGTTGARAIAADPTIVAVLGTSCSSAAVPAARILSEEGVLLMSGSNTAPALTSPDSHQAFYLRTAHNDTLQGAAMARFAAEQLGAKTAATIHDGSVYAEQLTQIFASVFEAEYGGAITGQEAVGVGETDFRPVLTSIAGSKPDLLYYPVFVAEGAHITAQAREISGLAETELAGADGMISPDWITAAGLASAEGVYLSGPDLSFQNDFYRSTLLPTYREMFGDPPNVFHAHYFDATNIVLDAIEKVALHTADGSLIIPRTALRDAVFATRDYSGVIGTLSCDENGDCNPGATIAVSQVQGGEFVKVWP